MKIGYILLQDLLLVTIVTSFLPAVAAEPHFARELGRGERSFLSL